MEPLDLWIEYVYTDTYRDKYLIIPEVEINDDIWNFRAVRYTINTEDWNFYPHPKINIYAYLYDTFNIMVF